MKKNMFLAVALLILLFGSKCFSYTPAIIGGTRGGAALGLMFESGPIDIAKLRFGFEANTGNTPGIVFIGGKWLLTSLYSRFPMFMSGGMVGYLGNNTDAGPYVSVIFEKFLDISPLFLELGIDIVNSGRLQFQTGYYF